MNKENNAKHYEDNVEGIIIFLDKVGKKYESEKTL